MAPNLIIVHGGDPVSHCGAPSPNPEANLMQDTVVRYITAVKRASRKLEWAGFHFGGRQDASQLCRLFFDNLQYDETEWLSCILLSHALAAKRRAGSRCHQSVINYWCRVHWA
jgi:hypothetical protein